MNMRKMKKEVKMDDSPLRKLAVTAIALILVAAAALLIHF